MQFAVSAAGIAIMIGVAALMEWFAAAQGASGSSALGRRRREEEREDDPCLTALRHRHCRAGIGLLSAPAEAFSQEQDCPVPERFYAFRAATDEDGQGARQRPGGRHRRARRSLHRGARGGRAQLGLARATVLGARQEIPVRAHQGRQPRRGTPDGEGGGRAPEP